MSKFWRVLPATTTFYRRMKGRATIFITKKLPKKIRFGQVSVILYPLLKRVGKSIKCAYACGVTTSRREVVKGDTTFGQFLIPDHVRWIRVTILSGLGSLFRVPSRLPWFLSSSLSEIWNLGSSRVLSVLLITSSFKGRNSSGYEQHLRYRYTYLPEMANFDSPLAVVCTIKVKEAFQKVRCCPFVQTHIDVTQNSRFREMETGQRTFW